MTQGTGYSDQYLLANPDGMLDATIGGGADGWEDEAGGRRMTTFLLKEGSPLEVSRARRVFTDDNLGRVSDHVGVFAEFVICRPGSCLRINKQPAQAVVLPRSLSTPPACCRWAVTGAHRPASLC